MIGRTILNLGIEGLEPVAWRKGVPPNAVTTVKSDSLKAVLSYAATMASLRKLPLGCISVLLPPIYCVDEEEMHIWWRGEGYGEYDFVITTDVVSMITFVPVTPPTA